MKKSIESKIRLNVILLYLLIALICTGFVFFFYSLAEQLNAKKTTFDEYYKELAIVNEMTYAINETQIEANLYIHTQNPIHLQLFREQLDEIELKIDSLRSTRVLAVDSIWDEINQLLKIKGNSITALNEQLIAQNEIVTLKDKALNKTIKSTNNKAIQDTIVHGGTKKKFWERVANVFNPDEKEDTIIVVKEEKTNIIKEQKAANTEDLNKAIQRTQATYTKRIEAIEDQIKQLVITDQEISARISDLLIQLNTEIIHSRWDELEKEEAQLQQNNKKALILGIIASVMILAFIIMIITDVNKGQALRKALEEAYKKNKEIMESRHKLLLSVSHDIKTPLNSILGYLEISKQEKELTDKEIASMRNSGKHILSLLSNLLEYSSLEQGKLQLNRTDFSLNELCDEVHEMFSPLAKAKNLFFTCEKDFDSTLILYSDDLRIRQILTNTLSNAIKYTQTGGIIFKTSYKKGAITFSITDTGAGIPEDKLNSIYKPFTRIDANNSLAEGNGFGMYVVKGLVYLFHGKINYKSIIGEGTTVSVNLPADKGKAKPEDNTFKNILIVDDDNTLLSMISRMCIQLGHKVTTCKTWTEFNGRLSDIDTFNMVLTDMEMADFSGQDILNKTKEHNLELPVVLMTGRMDYNTQLAQSEGFADYLSKPITLKKLYLVIGGVLTNNSEEEKTDNFLSEKNDEFVIEVIEEFLFSTINNVIELRNTVGKDDFEKAQFICHKMRPMFIQLGASEKLTSIMKEIDSFRNNSIPESYDWKEKITFLADETEDFLSEIQEKYFNND